VAWRRIPCNQTEISNRLEMTFFLLKYFSNSPNRWHLPWRCFSGPAYFVAGIGAHFHSLKEQQNMFQQLNNNYSK
jgi:hypothetical protein